jgi:hypothetical protein
LAAVATLDVEQLEARYRELTLANADGVAWLHLAIAATAAIVTEQRDQMLMQALINRGREPVEQPKVAPSEMLKRLRALRVLVEYKLVEAEIVLDGGSSD